ncbi:MAG: oxidoreductase [Thermoplasmata archaeon]|nr:MAG: oxidoreductase [Thermoplasmata archaeon]
MIKIADFVPEIAKIIETETLCPGIRRIKLEYREQAEPGQFFEISVFGFGEMPISASSWGTKNLEITVRDMGGVSRVLCNMRPGAVVGVRGPFGRGFPLEASRGKRLLLIAGGLGLAPLRSVISYLLRNEKYCRKATLLYGARKPELLLYRKEYEVWKKKMDVHLIVDEADKHWNGRVGVVTELFNEIDIADYDVALVCGPPVMMRHVVAQISRIIGDENTYLSLERRMKCGVGFCGHCRLGKYFVCRDGPVFSVAELKSAGEEVEEIGKS